MLGFALAWNAAGALATYAAKAGIEAFIFMPSDTPSSNIIECQQTGANVALIDGLISDCGRVVSDRKEAQGLCYSTPDQDSNTSKPLECLNKNKSLDEVSFA